jgi:hypothetical protein
VPVGRAHVSRRCAVATSVLEAEVTLATLHTGRSICAGVLGAIPRRRELASGAHRARSEPCRSSPSRPWP